ncbi:hypothetical protein R1sor_015092 [Riccia sorocarpa]|uniref:Phosphoglycerate mutase n=1 Tax=Riccia sorocarpa TaxID=122646 RepID=A0ABD3HBK0_9MARC
MVLPRQTLLKTSLLVSAPRLWHSHDLSNGLSPGYGLAPAGTAQAIAAGELFLKLNICYRTRQTAEAVAGVLVLNGLHPTIEFLEDLRERCFGANLEPKSHNHYLEIWKFDARDPLVGPEGGESVVDVAMRVIRALLRIEEEVQGHAVVIVSHGDTLQILQTVINHALGRVFTVNDSLLTRLEEAISPSILQRHRNFAMLTGELKRLQ